VIRLAKAWFLPAAVIFAISVVACGSGSTATPTNKTLVVETAFDFSSIDPARVFGSTSMQVVGQLYQTLLLNDERNPSKLDPGLAQSYAISSDGKSVTFNLRHDQRFSDGTNVTADDVVFSLTRNKNMNGAQASWVAGLTFTAPDKYTVVATAANANLAIASNLAVPSTGITNSKVLMANGGTDAVGADKLDTAEKFLNQQSIGSGPYEVVSLDPQSQIVLKANPYYGGPKPAYAKVVIRNVPAATQVLDVQANEQTVALDLSTQLASTLDKSKSNIFTTPDISSWTLSLNVDPAISPATANADIRQAIRYGIDYKALLALAGSGSVQAQGILSTGHIGALPSTQIVTRDVAKAKSLIAQSGVNNPTVVFDYGSDVTTDGLSYGVIAQSIQSSLKEIGINVVLSPAPNTVVVAKWKAGKIQMLLRPLGGNTFDPSTTLFQTPGRPVGSYMGWKTGADPALDAILSQITSATTVAQRNDLYMREQQLVDDDAVFIPLFHSPLVLATSKGVGGLNYDGLADLRVWELT
jgi:peptide/nickel transport system substrate-binding protein